MYYMTRYDYNERLWNPNTDHCRDPLGEQGHPWCYTMEPLVRLQLCDIPVCGCTYNVITKYPKGLRAHIYCTLGDY